MEQILSIDANPQPADTVIDNQKCALKTKTQPGQYLPWLRFLP